MYVDYKTVIWRRMKILDPIDKDVLVTLIEENNQGSYFHSNRLYDELDEHFSEPYDEAIDETEEPFPLNMNNGSPTVELYTDEDELLYDNINGKFYD